MGKRIINQDDLDFIFMVAEGMSYLEDEIERYERLRKKYAFTNPKLNEEVHDEKDN